MRKFAATMRASGFERRLDEKILDAKSCKRMGAAFLHGAEGRGGDRRADGEERRTGRS